MKQKLELNKRTVSDLETIQSEQMNQVYGGFTIILCAAAAAAGIGITAAIVDKFADGED